MAELDYTLYHSFQIYDLSFIQTRISRSVVEVLTQLGTTIPTFVKDAG